MDRIEIVKLRSEIIDSVKDLNDLWNGNDFQVIRLRRVVVIIKECVLYQSTRVELEGVSLIKVYKQACERINKDPHDFAQRALALAKSLEGRGSTLDDRKEFLGFCNVLKRCFDQVLGR